MRIGYIRVSTKEQNADRQVEALLTQVKKTFVDKATGINTDRPELRAMTIFFPCYNQGATVQAMCRRPLAVARAVTDNYEVIIVVDDGSRDRTASIVMSLAVEDAHLRLIRHETNQGSGRPWPPVSRVPPRIWCFTPTGMVSST